MDGRFDPRGQLPLGGPWAAQPAGLAAPPPAGPGDDAFVTVAGWVLAGLATVMVATVAVVSFAAFYGVATWRRWRWWPLVAAGAATIAVVVVATGPSGALSRHLLAVRELTGPHPGQSLGTLIGRRWLAWVLGQAPLALPFGAVLAGFARHHVTHTPAHELSASAQRRRKAEDAAQLRAAQRRSTNAPLTVGKKAAQRRSTNAPLTVGKNAAQRRAGTAPLTSKGRGVLGAWAGGDLTTWRQRDWCVVPDATLGLGTVVVGLPGSGKTETLLRLATLGFCLGLDVHVVDAKGDPATQHRFAAIAAASGAEAKLFPQEPYDGFRGGGAALRNRFCRVVDYSEPYYQDGARVLLAAATDAADGPPGSLAELLERLASASAEVDAVVRKGTLSRYRSFAAAVQDCLSGAWAYEDTRASYLLLDGVALGDDAPRLARYLVEDFLHYASVRKVPERKSLLLVDEFSALRLGNAAALLERLRSFGCGVVIAAQSVEGLHDDPGDRARLLNAASTLIAHRLADPEPIATRAGTMQRAERSHQLDGTGPTGAGSLRLQETFRVDPNELRALPVGVAWVVNGGRAARVAVARTPDVVSRQVGCADAVPNEAAPSGRAEASAGPGEEAWLA